MQKEYQRSKLISVENAALTPGDNQPENEEQNKQQISQTSAIEGNISRAATTDSLADDIMNEEPKKQENNGKIEYTTTIAKENNYFNDFDDLIEEFLPEGEIVSDNIGVVKIAFE
jgi:hypothetical protein